MAQIPVCGYRLVALPWSAALRNRILLVDDHQILRKGLRLLIGDAWDICGEAGDGKEAIEKVLELKPDLVVMDVSMPIMNGLEATRQIRDLAPQTKILMLSMHNSPELAREAKQAGADAYLVKSDDPNLLKEAIATLLLPPNEE